MKGYNAVLSGNITGAKSIVNMNNSLWCITGNSTTGMLNAVNSRVEVGNGKNFANLQVKELVADNSTFLMHTNNSRRSSECHG